MDKKSKKKTTFFNNPNKNCFFIIIFFIDCHSNQDVDNNELIIMSIYMLQAIIFKHNLIYLSLKVCAATCENWPMGRNNFFLKKNLKNRIRRFSTKISNLNETVLFYLYYLNYEIS